MHSPMLANYRNVNAVVWRVSTSSYRNDKRYDLQPNVLQCLSNSEQSLYSRKKSTPAIYLVGIMAIC